MAVTGSVSISYASNVTKTTVFRNGTASGQFSFAKTLTDGDGVDQVNKLFEVENTVYFNDYVEIDIGAEYQNFYGTDEELSGVKVFIVENLATLSSEFIRLYVVSTDVNKWTSPGWQQLESGSESEGGAQVVGGMCMVYLNTTAPGYVVGTGGAGTNSVFRVGHGNFTADPIDFRIYVAGI